MLDIIFSQLVPLDSAQDVSLPMQKRPEAITHSGSAGVKKLRSRC